MIFLFVLHALVQVCFVDDTNLTYTSNNTHEINHKLNEDLANVSEWLLANKVTLNETKTEFMLITYIRTYVHTYIHTYIHTYRVSQKSTPV